MRPPRVHHHASHGRRLRRRPDLLHFQNRSLAPPFGIVRHIRAELLLQAKADPVQLGGFIPTRQLDRRLASLGQVVTERLRNVPLDRRGIGWLLTICRARLAVGGRQLRDRLPNRRTGAAT